MLAVPNFATGDPALARRLAAAMTASGMEVLDIHCDPVHWRTVITAVGEGGRAGSIVAAARAASRMVEGEMDMEAYAGAHPAIGAIDVFPVVFVSPDERDEARAAAIEVADALGEEGVPVFLYGGLATAPERAERAYFRRGGTTGLVARVAVGEITPDAGPAVVETHRGATLVTARSPLVAFNVFVEGEGVTAEMAYQVAAGLREAGGGLPGVRAIAIDVGGRWQISTNVHEPAAVPLADVVGAVSAGIAGTGVVVTGAEIVGMVPGIALQGFPSEVPLEGFDPDRQVLERRLG